MTKLIAQLNWRYATKLLTGEKIPDQNLEMILEAIRLWDEYIKEIVNNTANNRNLPAEALDGYFNMVKANNDSLTETQRAIGASRQAYIALATALVAAAFEEVDASPMEGFNPAMVDELLGLKEKGLQSVVLLALGYRNEATDHLIKAKKVRKSKAQLFVEIN